MNIISGAIFELMHKTIEILKVCGKDLNADLKQVFEKKVKEKLFE